MLMFVSIQVNHSQSLNKPPVDVWFMGKSDGEVLAAHCTCMAGNGEACSHLAALLFYVEYGVRAREERSCTDGPNSWLPPLVKKLRTRPVAAMDLASSVMKKRRLDGEAKAVASQNLPPRPAAPAPTEEEWKEFFDSLIQSGHRPAVASTDPGYSDLYVPAVRSCPGVDLRRLYDRSALTLTHQQLSERCRQIYATMRVNEKAQRSIEERTRKQSMSVKWYAYRTGRITASTLYDVCHTRIEAPSLSLVKKICYPHEAKFSSPPVKYGKENETKALHAYKMYANRSHQNAQFNEAGLLVSQQHVFLGATPDMLVECSCCGKGLVEVKCPWSVRDGKLSDLLLDSNSFVTENKGALELRTAHRYFYQVQTQMYVWQRQYCDFVIWNKDGISIQRIAADQAFLVPHLDAAENFFCRVLLLELVAHWFTAQKENTAATNALAPASASSGQGADDPNTSDVFCVCKGPEEGKMIACDGLNCPVTWFHFRCVGLNRAPKSKKWYCDQCK